MEVIIKDDEQYDVCSSEEEVLASWKEQGKVSKTRPFGNLVLLENYEPEVHGKILYRKDNTTNLWRRCVVL